MICNYYISCETNQGILNLLAEPVVTYHFNLALVIVNLRSIVCIIALLFIYVPDLYYTIYYVHDIHYYLYTYIQPVPHN